MQNLKSSAGNKTVGGHFVGEHEAPLAYAAARREVYVPAYLFQLEKVRDVVEMLRERRRSTR